MRVLHVIPSLSPLLGGPTQVALNLVNALRQAGIDAEVVTTNDNGRLLLDVPLFKRIDYENIPVWFLPRSSIRLKEFIFSAALTRWLWQHVPTYDLLDNHYLFSYASTCAGVIARRHKVPYTVRTMGQLSPWALAQSRLKKQLYSQLIERRNLEHATLIHCTSAEEEQDVRDFGIQSPTVVLPLGVQQLPHDPDAQQKLRDLYQIAPTVPIILFLSRLHYKKRPDLLLRSLLHLAQDHEFHLIMAGSGDQNYLMQLQQLAVSLHLSHRVTWVGFVTGEDKDLLLQGSDLFVLPSFSENFGIAVAEAMAAGLPVILTPGIQIASEVAAAQAGLIVEGNEIPLAMALSQLLNSPELRQKLGKRGQSLAAKHYNWSPIAQQLVAVYQSALKKNTMPCRR